jgi:iron complex outermembrane receptor protein
LQAAETVKEEGPALEEIVVTARKVEENLMTVPVSVSALSATEIADRGIKDQTDVTYFQPSFRFVNQAGGQAPFVIRGNGAVTFRGLVEGGGSGSVFINGAPTVDCPEADDQFDHDCNVAI